MFQPNMAINKKKSKKRRTTKPVEVPKESKPIGRPTIFTKDLADIICEQLAVGTSMRSVCLREEMPSLQTVFRWLREDKEFSDQYARAKEESADVDNETLEDIGDMAIDAAQCVDPKASSAVVAAYKLKADNLKWAMSKKKPKKYGDSVDVTSKHKPIKGNVIIFKDFSNGAND